MKGRVFLAKAQGRQLHFSSPIHLRHYLIPLEGKNLRVYVEPQIPTRTIQQNRLYWLYLEIIADDTGQDIDDIHAYIKQKCLPPRILTFKGLKYTVPGSTRTLNKNNEWDNLLEKVRALAGWLGIELPAPTDPNMPVMV